MGKQSTRHGCRIAAALVLAGSLAACADEPPGPAPIFLRGGAPGAAQETALGPPPLPPEWRAEQVRPMTPQPIKPSAARAAPSAPQAGRQIVVRRGQSVGGLARDYHVSKRALIAANHLEPPYKIEIGQHLTIPGPGAAPAVREAASHEASPASERHDSEHRSAAHEPGQQHESTARRLPAAAPATPEIIPLDGPPPRAPADPETSAAAHHAHPDAEPPAARHKDGETPEAAGPKLPHGGSLPWPVSGHILASYGDEPSGGHNDGINIAAPRGTPVRAVEGGVVAYAGNELRGYGNLVLIKHPDGFISAYAHCAELLVKRGQHVTRGQVIAKVGATGGVGQPQLHFELRRGERPVDPKKFLAP